MGGIFGSSSRSSQTSTTKPALPDWMKGLIWKDPNSIIGQMTAAQGGGIPTISQLYGGIPQQGVTGLTDQENQFINAFQQMGANAGALNPAQQQAFDTYSRFASGDINASPAVQQAKEVFNTIVAPRVQQSANLAGLGRSGAASEALSRAGAEMVLPIIQQAREQALYAGMAQSQLGAQQYQQQVQNLANALSASGMPREQQQAILDAIFNQAQQKFGFGAGVQLLPFQLLGGMIGSKTSGGGSTKTTPGLAGLFGL